MHALAQEGSVSEPKVIAIAGIAEGAALLMTWAPGALLEHALQATPELANDFGIAAGVTLASIHAIPSPSTLDHDWLGWHPDVAPELRPLLVRRASTIPINRLLHLDYHSRNVLVIDDRVSSVLDWANARGGPPEADLVRTRSILRLVRLFPDMPPDARIVLDAFETGFLAGHAQLHGPTSDLAVFDARAIAVQIADLVPKIGLPDVGITTQTIRALQNDYDCAIARM